MMATNVKKRDYRVPKNEIKNALDNVIPKYIDNDDVLFFCIGTDRSTGDALAPLVGTQLKRLGYTNVMGTIDNPVHAMNLEENIRNIPSNKLVIAIDACLGHESSVGLTEIAAGSILAGAGVGKKLPPVGDYKIASIVNVGGFMEYTVLQNTRLSFVMGLAEAIATSLAARFPIKM